MDELQEGKEDVFQQTEAKDGYIYILFNDMFNFYGSDVFKIGKTGDVVKRMHGYRTSYLAPPEIKFISETCVNYTLAERVIFERLKYFRMKPNREFFKGDVCFFVQTIEDVVDGINNLSITTVEKYKTNDGIQNAHVEQQIMLIETMTKERFYEYLNSSDKEAEQFNGINRTIAYLSLDRDNTELLERYKDTIIDKHKFNEHLNIVKLLKTDQYLRESYTDLLDKHVLKTNLIRGLYKITLIRAFEKYYQMKPLELEAFRNLKVFKPMDKQLFDDIVKVFESKKKEPTDTKDLQYLYLLMIKHVTDKDIAKSIRSKRRADRGIYYYSINDDYIKYHIELDEYANMHHDDYHEHFMNMYGLNGNQ